MSAPAEKKRTDEFEELVRELAERLEGVPLHDAQVGPVEEEDGRRAVTLTFGEAEDEDDALDTEESFDELVEYLLGKNHELLRRLA